MEVNWDFNRKMERLELGLSWGAAIPFAGTLCAVAKVVIGFFQTLAGFFVSFYAMYKDDNALINFCKVHQEHGLYNMLAGAFEAVPLVGSLLYMFRCSNKPVGEDYQLITGHEMQFFPYRHLEISDAEIRKPSAAPGTGFHWAMAQACKLIKPIDWKASTKLQADPFTDVWKGFTERQKEWLVKLNVFMHKQGPGVSDIGVRIEIIVNEDLDFSLFFDEQRLPLVDIVPLWKVLVQDPSREFRFGEDRSMTLKKLAIEREDQAALKAILDWEEEICKQQAASSYVDNSQMQHSSPRAAGGGGDEDEDATASESPEASSPESPTAFPRADAPNSASSATASLGGPRSNSREPVLAGASATG
jgi:hypothetical protein